MTDEFTGEPPEAVDDEVEHDLHVELEVEIESESEASAADAGPAEPPAEPKPPARHARWGRPTRIAVVSLALTAMMFLFVFPTRSYLAQQRQVGRARDAVAVLKSQNEQLAREARLLRTRGEIERLAREQFNLVMPGESAYNVVPTPAGAATTTTVP